MSDDNDFDGPDSLTVSLDGGDGSRDGGLLSEEAVGEHLDDLGHGQHDPDARRLDEYLVPPGAPRMSASTGHRKSLIRPEGTSARERQSNVTMYRAAVASLPSPEQRFVMRWHFAGYQDKDLAPLMGISRQAVTALRERAEKTLYSIIHPQDCAVCGERVPVGRRHYCSDTCKGTAKKRRQRAQSQSPQSKS